jgi:hypothetical protein
MAESRTARCTRYCHTGLLIAKGHRRMVSRSRPVFHATRQKGRHAGIKTPLRNGAEPSMMSYRSHTGEPEMSKSETLKMAT